ncbi:Calcium/calmodulin-dependent protein kinase type I [Gurleya vavrai]
MLQFFFFLILSKSYIPKSLSPAIHFINNTIQDCLKWPEREDQNKIFDRIISDYVRPIKLTNSSAVFSIKKSNLIIKRFPERRNSTRNETKISIEVDHPNIIKTYISFEQKRKQGKIGWVISEYLDVIISKREMKNEIEIRRFCKDVCKGLDYLHKKDIAHLDIKLGNIMGKTINKTNADTSFIDNLLEEVKKDILSLKNKESNSSSFKGGLYDMMNKYGYETAYQLYKQSYGYSKCINPFIDYICKINLEENRKEELEQDSGYNSNNILYQNQKRFNLNNNKNIYKSPFIYSTLSGKLYGINEKKNEENEPEDLGGRKIVYKIIDFGFSRYIKDDSVIDMYDKYYGTFPYTPPEIFYDSIYSKKADIWCLGAMIYFLTSNKKLFYDKNNERDYTSYKSFLNGKEKLYFGNFSEELKDFVKICLNIDFRARPTAENLLEHSFIKGIN